MCIAALLKPGANLSDSTIHQMFRANQDGAGLAYVKSFGGKPEVVIKKGFFRSQTLVDELRKAQELADKDSPIIVHCRIATQGRITTDNCHPFPVKNGALIHNGGMWYGMGRTAERSDTREFCSRMFNNMVYEDLVFNVERLNKALLNNKLVMLFNDKRYVILNEDLGLWTENDTVWFSNAGFRGRDTTPCVSCAIPQGGK